MRQVAVQMPRDCRAAEQAREHARELARELVRELVRERVRELAADAHQKAPAMAHPALAPAQQEAVAARRAVVTARETVLDVRPAATAPAMRWAAVMARRMPWGGVHHAAAHLLGMMAWVAMHLVAATLEVETLTRLASPRKAVVIVIPVPQAESPSAPHRREGRPYP